MFGEARHSRARLALLLSGGGSTCRRRVAALEVGADAIDDLGGSAKLEPLRRTAGELVDGAARAVLERVHSIGWRWLVPGDEGFPELLTQSSDPPLGLFVRGELPVGPAAAVVGARKATAYGREVARLLGAEMAQAGISLVSGMARGIDAVAHQAILDHGGRTVAIWGTGPDQVYPPEHAGLAEAIAASGALVTEYPPETPPRRHHFPERNRLIASWSPAVVVVEAAVRSGALVTARQALEEGREVLAVPGNILSPMSVGPNALIRMGAKPLLTPRDLHETVGVSQVGTIDEPELEPGHPLLAAMTVAEPIAVDELAVLCKRSVPEVLSDLLTFELDGRVERQPDGRYVRRDSRV